MGKQGGQGKGKPKKKDKDFGKALLKKHIHGARGSVESLAESNVTNLRSVLENTSLDEFISTIDMADADVEVRRVNQNDAFIVEPTVHQAMQQLKVDHFDIQYLKIPRKPAWDRKMTSHEVDRREKDAFLTWRREIASVEASNTSLKVTPFEKNLEVWRQLWRVVEKSDLLIQIVDARNPLLFLSKDLIAYAREQDTPRNTLILVNKSDLLTDYQREEWAKEFTELGIRFIFYSAKLQQHIIDEGEMDSITVNHTIVEHAGNEILTGWQQQQSSQFNPTPSETSQFSSSEETSNISLHAAAHIFTRPELISLLEYLVKHLNLNPKPQNKSLYCVGMVGFPNVGKSSVINTLLGVSKSTHGSIRVGVSSTPGKTKHFQTIHLSDIIMLCDCPGLVFPSFMQNVGEMLCSGILPINQMRDFIEPATIIASRIPQHLLEATYGCRIRRQLDVKDDINRPPTASEFLSSYCALKGYITTGTGGRWDEFRGCKAILRDYNDGVLLSVSPPEHQRKRCNQENKKKENGKKDDGIEDAESKEVEDEYLSRWLKETEQIMLKREKISTRLAKLEQQKAKHLLTSASASASATPAHQQQQHIHVDATTGNVFVFGDGKTFTLDEDALHYDPDASPHEHDDGFDVESEDEEEEEDGGKPRREHKKIKKWGKKNKKLRNKDPYSEENGVVSYVAYSTNRQSGRNDIVSKKSHQQVTGAHKLPHHQES